MKRKYELGSIAGISSRTKVKLRVLGNNQGKSVYGVTLPRQIALGFLEIDSFLVYTSGLGIVLEPAAQEQ